MVIYHALRLSPRLVSRTVVKYVEIWKINARARIEHQTTTFFIKVVQNNNGGMLRGTTFLARVVACCCKEGTYNHKLLYHKPPYVVEYFYQSWLYMIMQQCELKFHMITMVHFFCSEQDNQCCCSPSDNIFFILFMMIF